MLTVLLASLTGCGDGDPRVLGPTPENDGGTDSGAPPENDGGLDAGEKRFGPLVVDTEPGAQELDLFGQVGHRFWIQVSDQQRELMNDRGGGGLPGPALQREGQPPLEPAYRIEDQPPVEPGWGDDIYTPGDGGESATFADHVVVQDAATGSVADYGQIKVKIIGESTFREWTSRTIPNVRIDTDEFQKGLRIGGYEHFRFNNGLVGSIFREHIALRIFRELGYPAIRSTFAFLGSNVWGSSTWIPMTLTEVYKRRFCEDNAAMLGGTCTNMWEYAGDAGMGDMPSNACQVDQCDNQRMVDLEEALSNTPPGAGFGDALSDIIDWPMFHRFQCISWILATGDDAIRSMNNNLIIQRDSDDKLVFAPYSVDISAGQDWQTNPPLLGSSTLARGCQADPDCWAETVAACETLMAEFDALDPENIVDETTETLMEHGMMRAGDTERAAQIRQWYLERQSSLAAELERFRYLPDGSGVCPNDLVACDDGGCGTVEDCETRRCSPPTTWCEPMQQCIDEQWQECLTCEGETPFYCPLDQQCVAGIEVCSAQCELTNGPGWVFCPATGWCELGIYCGDGEPLPLEDGGLPPAPDGGGDASPDGGVITL